VPGRSASALVEEPLAHFDDFVTEPGDPKEFGPDLAFVRIPSPSGFLATLIAKKSFYDLTAPGVADRIVFITRTAPMASCGVVAEKTERSNGQTTINSTVFLVTEPQSFEREGYDYVDVRSPMRIWDYPRGELERYESEARGRVAAWVEPLSKNVPWSRWSNLPQRMRQGSVTASFKPP
jgi:hypothetical protein